MPSRDQLIQALRNADRAAQAGDQNAAADARRLAEQLSQMNMQEQKPAQNDLHPFDPQYDKPRPNPDGSISTELTRTVQTPEGWANVPSLWYSDKGPHEFQGNDDALAQFSQQYEQKTGRRFPRYQSQEEAVQIAKERSSQGGAQHLPLADRTWGGAALEGLQNIPHNAMNYGRSIGQSISNTVQDPRGPMTHMMSAGLDTAKNLGKAALGGASMLAPERSALAEVGDQFQPQAKGLWDSLKNRYGGGKELRNTLATDPLGLGLDVASIPVGGEGLLAKIPGLSRAAEMASTAGRIPAKILASPFRKIDRVLTNDRVKEIAKSIPNVDEAEKLNLSEFGTVAGFNLTDRARTLAAKAYKRSPKTKTEIDRVLREQQVSAPERARSGIAEILGSGRSARGIKNEAQGEAYNFGLNDVMDTVATDPNDIIARVSKMNIAEQRRMKEGLARRAGSKSNYKEFQNKNIRQNVAAALGEDESVNQLLDKARTADKIRTDMPEVKKGTSPSTIRSAIANHAMFYMPSAMTAGYSALKGDPSILLSTAALAGAAGLGDITASALRKRKFGKIGSELSKTGPQLDDLLKRVRRYKTDNKGREKATERDLMILQAMIRAKQDEEN